MTASVAPELVVAPLTMTWSYCVPAVVPAMSTASVLPEASERLPLTVSVPAPLSPGDRVPPLCTLSVCVEALANTLPVPPSVPPDATVTLEVAPRVPSTCRVPALTVVEPV